MKVCNKCHRELDEGCFHKNSYSCKECYSSYYKEYRKNNKAKLIIKAQDYYKNNKNIIIEQHKKYRQNNKEIVSETKKEYYKKNKKEIIQRQNKREAERRREDVNFKLKKTISSSIRYYLKKQGSTKYNKAY